MSIIRQNFGSFGDSANWVTDAYGNAQEKTLAANDTSVTFDIPDNTDSNCYTLCVSTASAATANTQPPKATATVPTYGTSSRTGYKTVTYPLTAVTAAQAGSKCRLLVVNERSTDYRGIYSGGGVKIRKKIINDLIITVISNGSDETFIVGGRISGTLTLNGWTTVATITDSDFIPSRNIRGVCTDANAVSKQVEFTNGGIIMVYGSGSYVNPYFSING